LIDMTFTARVENLEIRGKEIKDGKNGKYAVVRFDNEAGDRLEFVDRDEERFDYYKRGKVCDVYLRITNTPKYTNFTISEMRYREDE
jgi:hypothetical protein